MIRREWSLTIGPSVECSSSRPRKSARAVRTNWNSPAASRTVRSSPAKTRSRSCGSAIVTASSSWSISSTSRDRSPGSTPASSDSSPTPRSRIGRRSGTAAAQTRDKAVSNSAIGCAPGVIVATYAPDSRRRGKIPALATDDLPAPEGPTRTTIESLSNVARQLVDHRLPTEEDLGVGLAERVQAPIGVRALDRPGRTVPLNRRDRFAPQRRQRVGDDDLDPTPLRCPVVNPPDRLAQVGQCRAAIRQAVTAQRTGVVQHLIDEICEGADVSRPHRRAPEHQIPPGARRPDPSSSTVSVVS